MSRHGVTLYQSVCMETLVILTPHIYIHGKVGNSGYRLSDATKPGPSLDVPANAGRLRNFENEWAGERKGKNSKDLSICTFIHMLAALKPKVLAQCSELSASANFLRIAPINDVWLIISATVVDSKAPAADRSARHPKSLYTTRRTMWLAFESVATRANWQ